MFIRLCIDLAHLVATPTSAVPGEPAQPSRNSLKQKVSISEGAAGGMSFNFTILFLGTAPPSFALLDSSSER